jgi:hypothetical protein
LAVPGPQIFSEPAGAVVSVTNWIDNDEAGELHRGLFIDVDLDATTPTDSLRQSLGYASATVSLLAFGAVVAAGPIRPLISYVERLDRGCDVLQFEAWPVDSSSRRVLRTDVMRVLTPRFSGLPENDRDRVTRGLDWYRKALSETNVFDRFSAAWTGLESINPTLVSRRSLSTTRNDRACERCGTPITDSAQSAGAKELILRRMDETTWHKVYRFRQGLMHSTKRFSELIRDAPDCSRLALQALRIGLLELLEATADFETLPTSSPMRLPERNRIEYEYVMQPLQLPMIPLGRAYPRIGLSAHAATRTKTEDGFTSQHVVHDLELLDFHGELVPPLRYGVSIPSADPDTPRRGFQVTSFEIRSKETGAVIATGTLTPIPDDQDPESIHE